MYLTYKIRTQSSLIISIDKYDITYVKNISGMDYNTTINIKDDLISINRILKINKIKEKIFQLTH